METGALDAYLLWEAASKTIHDNRLLEHSPVDQGRISATLASATEQITRLPTETKLNAVAVQAPHRANLLRAKRWALEQYPVRRLGTVLPYMGDVPIEEIVKSFVEVAGFVERQPANSAGSVHYIRALATIPDILEKIPIMVIEPGSQQRRPEVLRERGREDLAITPTDAYIEDGNHRALALMIANPDRTTIPGWVGRNSDGAALSQV